MPATLPRMCHLHTMRISILFTKVGTLPESSLYPVHAISERLHVRTSAIAYITLSLAIGPGLISNFALKDNMGRARPAQVVEFGGTHTFTPAWVPSDQCPKNCSFVSGHAAFGFFLVTFAFLMAPGYRRRAVFAATLAVAAAIGMARIGQGRHFLSDTIFAGFVNFAVAWALYVWLAARDGPGGRFLRRWDERLATRAEPGAAIAISCQRAGGCLRWK